MRATAQQRLQSLEAIVHGREQGDGLAGRDLPLSAHGVSPGGAICGGKAAGVDGAAQHGDPVGRDAKVVLEVSADHVAIDDDEGRLVSLELPSLELAKRAVSRIEGADGSRQEARQRIAELEHALPNGGDVQSTLWIGHIDTGHLVEADGQIVMGAPHRLPTSLAEPPGTKEARRTFGYGMNLHARWHRGDIPRRGVQMHGMPVAIESANQVGDVDFAAPAGRHHHRMTNRQVHAYRLLTAASVSPDGRRAIAVSRVPTL